MRPAEAFDALVRQAHVRAAQAPAAYRRRVVGLALIGTTVLHSVWVALALGGCAAVAHAGATPELYLVAVGSFVAAAMWLALLFHADRDPDGIRVAPSRAPMLFEVLRQVARDVGAPMPTEVWLMAELNAWVQVHRRAAGTWRLWLGVPLLLTHDLPQLKSVLGHELGHFASGTVGARLVWSQQAAWHSTLELLGRSGAGAFVRWALGGWALRFQAESVAMARQHERDSDDAGARVSSPRARADSLLVSHLVARLLDDRFWPDLWARTAAAAPDDVFLRMQRFLAARRPEDVAPYLPSELKDEALPFDPHPSLADRIARLGLVPTVPARGGPPAAEVLFGEGLEAILKDVGRWWATEVRSEWEGVAAEARAQADHLARHGRRPATELHPADALLVARALRRERRLSEAMPFYLRAQQLNGDDAATCLACATALLESGDPAGLTLMKRAVDLSQGAPEFVVDAFLHARRFLEARGTGPNPFARAFRRLRLEVGRRSALHAWTHRAARLAR